VAGREGLQGVKDAMRCNCLDDKYDFVFAASVIKWHYATIRKIAGSIPYAMNYFFMYLILPAALDLEFTQPLIEMSTRNRKIMFLGSRARPMRKANNLAAVCKPNV
jgi:hypothetical protein